MSGSGTAADPLKQITQYGVHPSSTGELVKVVQTTTYVNGSQEFRVHWDVTNESTVALRFKVLAAADFFFEGDDAGVGIFTEGPPRFIGGTNVDSGSSGGFAEVLGSGLTAWTHYQALDFPTVWGKVQGAAADTNPVFDDSVLNEPRDNAGGVEWDDALATPLDPSATRAYEIVVRSAVPSALQLTPTNAGSRQGVAVAISAVALDSNGQPYASRPCATRSPDPTRPAGSATLKRRRSGGDQRPGNERRDRHGDGARGLQQQRHARALRARGDRVGDVSSTTSRRRAASRSAERCPAAGAPASRSSSTSAAARLRP